jgi:hypothetical protein
MSVKGCESSESQIGTVQPIYTKIYKLQQQITGITANCSECQWNWWKQWKSNFNCLNNLHQNLQITRTDNWDHT